jgi:hypothetical protein
VRARSAVLFVVERLPRFEVDGTWNVPTTLFQVDGTWNVPTTLFQVDGTWNVPTTLFQVDGTWKVPATLATLTFVESVIMPHICQADLHWPWPKSSNTGLQSARDRP